MSIDDYVRALESELRDQPRSIRRIEATDLREHLEELPLGALDQLDAPDVYAHEYAAQLGLRRRRILGAWRRTSWPMRLLSVAIALVLVAAVTIPPWIAHYQPVTAEMFFGGPTTAPSRHEHDATVFSYRDGAIVRLGVGFHNSGGSEATITGFDDGPELGVLKLTGVRLIDRVEDCCSYTTSHPGHFPVRVPAYSSRWIMLELRMTNCEWYGNVGDDVGGGNVGYDQLRFPMKILGVHHVVVAPLFGSAKIFVDLPGPLTTNCPRKRSG